jgi:hypothetical protein
MKKQTQRKFNLVFKVNVALEAVWNQKILAELAKEYDNNPVMISTLKADLQENISATFEKSMDTQAVEQKTWEL